MKRHRAVLLNRGVEQLLEPFRGVRWGDNIRTDRPSDFELDGRIYRLRAGRYLGQAKLALISQGQFLAMKAIIMDGAPIWGLFKGQGLDTLNPRIGPYGVDAGWYKFSGPKDEVETVLNALIIEENQ